MRTMLSCAEDDKAALEQPAEIVRLANAVSAEAQTDKANAALPAPAEPKKRMDSTSPRFQ